MGRHDAYAERMRGVSRLDAVLAAGFVLAAVVEAIVRFRSTPGLLAFNAVGALWLGSLAVRRQRPPNLQRRFP